jgi:4'-phosphopantetheinyl transferase
MTGQPASARFGAARPAPAALRQRRGAGLTWLRLPGGPSVAACPQSSLAAVPPLAVDLQTVPDGPGPARAERLAVRALLRRLLAEVVGPDAARARIATRAAGQPYLPDLPGLGISLSHDGGWVAAALGAGHAVGVDVQLPAPASAALLRRCCAAEVRAELSALPARLRDREFAWIWTAQEACVKATGAGLAGRPWTVPVRRGQRVGRWGAVRWVSLRRHSAVPLSVAYRASAEG